MFKPSVIHSASPVLSVLLFIKTMKKYLKLKVRAECPACEKKREGELEERKKRDRKKKTGHNLSNQ